MYIDYKKNHKSKGLLKLALMLVLILITAYLFFNTWVYTYNEMLRMPYIMKGNYFLTLVYTVLYIIFLTIYEGFGIDQKKLSSVLYALTLTVVTTNILIYLVGIIPAAAIGFMPILPLITLTIKDFVALIIWSLISKKIFKMLYPPTPMLLISNQENENAAIEKFNERKDIYNIVDSISVERPFNEIKDKCDKFSNVVIGDIPSELRNDIIKYCFNNSINIYALPKLSDILMKYSEDLYSFDAPMYYSSNEGITLMNEIIKRAFDIVFSLMVLIIFSPLFLLVSILIKIEDGGNVFFMQERVTKDNKIFNIIKFRSMCMDADKHGVRPTGIVDDRITKIGNIIRKTHFDEFPQFINVLIGDMSVVGPRPERKEHVALYTQDIKEFEFRLKVKAGITGLAQIYGRYNTSAYDKLKLDLIYIKSFKFIFDIEIILKTLQVVFLKEKSEGFDEKIKNRINQNAKQN